jgi:methyl-accepting chemotaxis protein
VDKGVKLVGVAHGAFTEVSATIAGGSQAVSHIATSSEEQSRGITSIGQAISRIQSVTQSNAANAHQTAEAAANMGTQVETTRRHLDELVEVVGLRQS